MPAPVKKTELVCEQCGDIFYRVPSMVGRFCSKQCYWRWMKNNITPPPRGESREYKCVLCGKKFVDDASSKRKYCSRECYYKHSSQLKKGKTPVGKTPSIIKSCEVCGKKLRTSKARRKEGRGRFCSKICFAKWQSETMKGKPTPMPPMIGKEHPNYKGKIDVSCETCGKPFLEYPYRKDRHHFCSVECFREWKEYIPNIETQNHIDLKNKCGGFLEELGYDVIQEKWVTIDGSHYKIDVYATKGEQKMLVECGYCTKKKKEALTRFYDVIHVPYGKKLEEMM